MISKNQINIFIKNSYIIYYVLFKHIPNEIIRHILEFLHH